MPITLPASPTLNQRYTYSGSTYKWNGTVWNIVESTTSNSIGPTGPTGPIGTSETYSPIVIKLAAGDADYTGTATVNVPAGTYYVNQSFDDSQIIIGGQTITGNGTLTLSSPATSATIIAGGIKSWDIQTHTASLYTINSVCYGTSGYVAVGNDANFCYTSTDAITWVTRSLMYGGSANKVKFLNGLYVATGYPATIYTSTNAVTWTSRTSGMTGLITIYDVIYANGLYVAAGQSGNLATSTDAITWTTRTSGFGTSTIFGLSYGNGIYLAAGRSGTLATSTDAITWTTRTSNLTYTFRGILYGASGFLAYSAYGYVSVSTDGITWVANFNNNKFTPSGSTNYAGFYQNGTYYVGGNCNLIAFSISGNTATGTMFNINPYIRFINDFCISNDKTVGVGSNYNSFNSANRIFSTSLSNIYGRNKYDNYASLTPMEVL